MQRHIFPLKDLRWHFMIPETFSGPNKVSKMELFAEKVTGFQSFIIFVKSAILDVLNMF